MAQLLSVFLLAYAGLIVQPCVANPEVVRGEDCGHCTADANDQACLSAAEADCSEQPWLSGERTTREGQNTDPDISFFPVGYQPATCSESSDGVAANPRYRFQGDRGPPLNVRFCVYLK